MADARSHLPRMVLYARVVEHGSFSAAARALGLSRSVLSEAVSSLEAFMECRLLHRTTRAVRPTELGALFYERCRRIAHEVDAGMAELEARREGPKGTLRLTAPRGLVPELVLPVVSELHRTTAMEVELIVDDGLRDLVREGFDVSLRVGRPRDSSLTIRRLGKSEEVLVAAPAIAAQLEHVDQLGAAPWVAHTSIATRVTLRDARGRRRSLDIKAALRTNDSHAHRAMAVAGLGVAMMPYLVARPEIEAGRLVRLFPELRAPSLDLFVLMPSRQHVPARVRMLIEALRRRFDHLKPAIQPAIHLSSPTPEPRGGPGRAPVASRRRRGGPA